MAVKLKPVIQRAPRIEKEAYQRESNGERAREKNEAFEGAIVALERGELERRAQKR